jgi:hypothetical protein
MNHEQKIVVIGAASGVLLMLIGVWVLTNYVVPAADLMDTTANRLAYALEANVFALLPFFVMMIFVGNGRFLSNAIDPTRHTESRSMEINGRVADNTLQQAFVFFVASMTLATVLPYEHLHVVWAVAIWFVFARIVFWVGYRIHPLLRAPGMSATAYLNLGVIVYVLYNLFAQ